MRHVVAILALVAACHTTNETLCDDVGDCAHGGSDDWVAQCKASATALETEAKNSAGCGDLHDAYYDCAKDRYTCTAGVASFPGCDRTALDACLTQARNGTACADLGAHCTGIACSTAQSCHTRCFLNVVKNACAPTEEELDGVAVCSASCQ